MGGGVSGVVGREAELASVAAAVAAASDGPAACLIEGEAGIGKTTVWRHAIDIAAAAGDSVLTTRPTEAETGLPYAGLGDLLGGVAEEDLAALPPAQRRAIDVALLRAEPGADPLDQRAIGVGLVALLGRLSARRPVLIAIDDAQWLDEPTTSVLAFAARRLTTERVGFIVATRTDGRLRRSDPFGLAAALPGDRIWTIEISPLAADELERLLLDRLGVALPASTLRRVHELSTGNPFYALEIGRALVRQGVATGPGFGLPVPDTLRELVLERLYHLPGTTRDVLLVVAALSRPTVELVGAGFEDSERTAQAISRAEDAGVLELDGQLLRFTHPLLGSVLYADTAPDTRRRLHRRLAGIVGDPDERARHLALGAIGADETAAAELEAAALRTRARGAPDAAATLADEARRLTPAGRGTDQARRTLVAADALLDAGMSAAAGRLLTPMLDAPGLGATQARALHAMGRVQMQVAGLRTAEPLLQRAAAVAGDDAALQAAIGRDLSIALSQTGDLRLARDASAGALAWADRTGDPALIASSAVNLASVEFLLGMGIRDDLLERAAAVVASAGLAAPDGSTAYVPVDLVWGAVLKWSDQFETSRERFEAVRKRAVDAGDETAWIPWSLQAGELELWAGNWVAAATIDEAGRRVSERRAAAMQQDHAYLTGALAAHQGNVTAARAAIAESTAQAERTSDRRFLIRSHALLGFLELSLGDASAAAAPLEQAWELFRDAGYGDPGVVRFVPDLIEARLHRGDGTAAAELQAWLAERGRTLDRPYALATAARSLALIHASAGRVDAALAALGEALEHHRRLPQPFELARTQLVQGTLLRRTKAKKDARGSLTAALATFERLGARLWADRARGELGRISGRAASAQGLTPTEAEIARLAAQGYGNREIAEKLVVSPKTVEAHLTRIFDKLEVRSRGELIRRSRSGDFPDVPSDAGS